MAGRLITEQEKEIVRQYYASKTAKEIALMIDRSESSVYGIASALGLKKNAEFIAAIARKNYYSNPEKYQKGQFKKGLKPWNKNTKGLCKSNKTSFKKGNLPHNTRIDGDLSLRNDKSGVQYYHIRLSNAKWVLAHRYFWEQAYGPVPDNHIVVFKDGNTHNYALENLEMISYEENMRRNSIQNYPKEIKEVIRLNAKLTKTINRYAQK
jgi:DNA-binding CsgD family transcriptional regulator